MEILKEATEWAKAEVFSSRFFILAGIIFVTVAIGFWQLGKTEVAKAFVSPLAVTGTLLMVIGTGILVTNYSRISGFEKAYQEDAAAFIKSEISRTEKVIGEYRNIVFKAIPFIIIAAALCIAFLDKPLWRAISISVIAMMVIALLVDSNAHKRIQSYHEKLIEAQKEASLP